MPEMAYTGKYHRYIVVVGGGNDLFVSDAASRLDNCGRASVGYDINPVAEREESIRGDDRTGQR
jgi:hypothetical protein